MVGVKNYTWALLVLVSLIVLPSAALPQESPSRTATAAVAADSLQLELEALLDRHHLPGMWAAKVSTDGVEWSGAAGIRKWGHEPQVGPDDRVHLGSCTKAMTAVLIAKLCSEGKLAWESPLQDVFANRKVLKDSDWGAVTIRELLEHRSGAPANALWHKLDSEHPADVVAAREAMLTWLLKRSRPKKPLFVYSNVGYALLGHVVEELRGKPWEDVIRDELFKPLGMSSAGFGPVARSDGDDVEAPWGHQESADLARQLGQLFGQSSPVKYSPQNIDNSPSLGPAGRVHATLGDWSKFTSLFIQPDAHKQLGIDEQAWQQLVKPTAGSDYAGGWVLLDRDWAGGRTLFHNGSNTTWYCVVFIAPEKGVCYLAACNAYSRAAEMACDEAVQAMITK